MKPLQEAWTTFDPMLAHGIQLLQCIEISLDFLHVSVHVKLVWFHPSSVTQCALGSPTHLPFHWKIYSSLNGTLSTMWYCVV
jgi:hypothetical protein